jgi:hypothetical protein
MTWTDVRERIVVPELSLKEFVFSPPDKALRAAERPAYQRGPIPGPTEFAISLKMYVDKVAVTCPLDGHGEIAKREKIPKTLKHFHMVWHFLTISIRSSEGHFPFNHYLFEATTIFTQSCRCKVCVKIMLFRKKELKRK